MTESGRTLDAQVAVVTGAGSGIGQALAIQLAGRRAQLGLFDVDGEAIEETVRRCTGAGGEAHPVATDVSDWPAVARFADDVATRFGRVDLAFCAAGVIHTGDILNTDPADYDHVLRTNVLGAFHTAKAFLPYLIASRGRLVFVSSAFGLMAAPNYSAYCASKFAVRALAESLRQELALAGHDVTVTCAYPGGVRTEIMRRGRFAAGVDRESVIRGFDRLARTSPEDAAAQIIKGVERGKHRILIGQDARAVSAFIRVTGGAYPGLVVQAVRASRVLGRASARIRGGR